MKKIIILLAIIVIAASSFFYLKGNKRAEEGNSYITSTVTKGDVIKEVSASGTINPVNVVDVGTQVSGTIEKTYVDFNDQVEKGQLLAELDKSVLETELKASNANLKKARATAELAKLELERTEELFKNNYIAKAELDQAKTSHKTAQAELESAKYNYEKAETNLDYTIITSPVSGVIISREVDEGQTVAASLQAPELFTIAEDLTKMQIEASVAEADVGIIKKGQEVTFTVDAYADETFTGAVKQIRLNPTTESNVVTYTVIINIENKELKLLPGMTAFISIIIDKREDALQVSNSVIDFEMPMPKEPQKQSKMKDGDREGEHSTPPPAQMKGENEVTLWLIDNAGQIKPVNVIKGLATSLNTEIISDEIKEGDVVIEDSLTSEEASGNTNARRGMGIMGGGGPGSGGPPPGR